MLPWLLRARTQETLRRYIHPPSLQSVSRRHSISGQNPRDESMLRYPTLKLDLLVPEDRWVWLMNCKPSFGCWKGRRRRSLTHLPEVFIIVTGLSYRHRRGETLLQQRYYSIPTSWCSKPPFSINQGISNSHLLSQTRNKRTPFTSKMDKRAKLCPIIEAKARCDPGTNFTNQKRSRDSPQIAQSLPYPAISSTRSEFPKKNILTIVSVHLIIFLVLAGVCKDLTYIL